MSARVHDMAPKVALGLLIVGIALAAFVEGRSAVPVGRDAPAVQFERHAGGTLKISDLKGKLVLVNFWATWCPPCVEEMPHFLKVARKYEAQGLQFVAASADDEESWKADVSLFADRMKLDLLPYVVFATDDSKAAYGVKAFPTTVLVGADGKIVATKRGLASEKWLEENISEHLPK